VAAVPACSKPNDQSALEDEAHGLVKCQDTKLSAFQQRSTAILRATQGRALPPDVQVTLGEAGGKYETLQQITRQLPLTGDKLVKDNRLADYEKLIMEDEEQAEKADIIVEDDLANVESWVQRNVAIPPVATQPAPPPPPPPAPPIEEPAPAPAHAPAAATH
jgi:hypothetical protein